jgi:peptidoglycan/xylan/chitin deacetylase (PgdA/CDA1 family)
MIAALQNLVRAADAAVARAYLSVRREQNALMPFLFHSLFRDQREMDLNVVEPLERTTVAHFRQFIEYYLEHGYRFVGPADLLKGLAPDGKYVMITFDDGYFNNTLARPVLEEFKVPALFFISTNHVLQNKCYWWDVFYRERTAQGATRRQIYGETLALKGLRTERIEAQLVERFGANALTPRGDVDRPFTPSELRDFAASPYVHLGNHTANHAILTNYAPDEVRQQVQTAQTALQQMTGVLPTTIAYPNGAHNAQIVEICREIGLKMGVTVRPHKTRLPLASRGGTDLMRLGRFCPNGDDPIVTQCRTYRSDLQLYGALRSGYLRLLRGQVAQ